MAIGVTFYHFSKRVNSTKQPSSGTTYSCVLKDGSSIVNPTIELSLNSDPSNLNYAYIADYSRYYWVNDWTYYRGVWTASMTVDVLATYKTTIGSSTQYVIRSASASDGDVVDSYYPTVANPVDLMSQGTGGFNTTFNTGSYVFGFISKDSGGFGAVNYFVLSPAACRNFMGYLLGDYSYMGTITEISQDLQKALINPTQYIASCMWFPFDVPHQETAYRTISFGTWSFTFTVEGAAAYRITNTALYVSTLTSVVIPKHPQSTLRGNYLNMGQFSRYFMDFKPWGEFEIDPSFLIKATNLYYSYSVDCVSGMGILRLSTDASFSRIFKTLRQMVGIPVQMSSISVNILSGAVKTAQGAAAVASGIASENYPAAAAAVFNTIGNAIEGTLPTINSTGSTGSLGEYQYGSPKLIGQFFKIADEDNADAGRPLCTTRVLSSLSGFIKCAHADIAIAATEGEISQVRDYMEGGFFYE